MLLGEYQHTIDEKGRMAVPSKFRKSFAAGVVVTKGTENCLDLYPVEEWTKLAEKLSQFSVNHADARAVVRLRLAGASHVELDGQGRVLIPDYLRAYAGIGVKATIIGLYNRAEIWDEEKWRRYRADVEAKGDEIAERLGELGA
ncbi:MAG: division/cell wall cluster transcriptional repressor MraZ [bacterium]|nr:division/cell wall cluster transcriptional repressor MraZ [bacterium]